MLVETTKLLVKGKASEERTSSKTGNTYKDNVLYLQTEDKIIYEIHFVSDYIYNKTRENANVKLKYYIATKGNIELNDVEEIK